MQPKTIKRRTFLQGLFGAPFLAFVRPRVSLQTTQAYTDDLNTADFSPIHDGNLATGIEYTP